MSFAITLNVLERRNAGGGSNFSAIWHRWKRGVLLRGQPRIHPKDAWLQRPPNFWDLLRDVGYTCTQYEKQRPNFTRGPNLMWGKFYTLDHGPCPGQNFWWHECWRAICLRHLTSLSLKMLRNILSDLDLPV